MKGKLALFTLTAGVLAVTSLTGCGKKEKPTPPEEEAKITGVAFEKSAYVADIGGKLELDAQVLGTGKYDTSVTYSIPASEYFTLADGVLSVADDDDAYGESIVVTATAKGDATKKAEATVTAYELANGYFDYSGEDGDEKAKILGTLEKYAVDTHLTGLTIMGNGGYVMYADGITKGTNTFIPGYGFGVLAEGEITKPLTGEGVQAKYNMYYHTFMSSDPQSVAYMNSKASDVSDLLGYQAAGYFDTEMNETKDGYNWVGDLAKVNRAIPVDLDEDTGKATTFKFPVKVGEELKYSTNSKLERFAAYNNRGVELEDYITPYKIYYTQAYGLARSAENLTGSSSLKGTKAYYDASKEGFSETAWKNVGIEAFVDEDDGLSYLQFTFNYACTPFEATYQLASGMFAPVPESFVLECAGAGNKDLKKGVLAWGVSNEDGKETPADHYLSTGAYVVEEWNIDQNIVFQKNPNYADRGRYKIVGVHINILKAVNSDPEAGFKEFLAGNLSAAGIPSTQLATYKNDPRTTTTASSSNFKLNLNTCDEELWDKLFGKDGEIAQNETPWDVKPAMSNKSFLAGLNYSLNRVGFCDKIGRVASCEYFADTYLIDPENGISYNSTDAHAAAIAEMVAGTDGFGYSLELARAAFVEASEELIAEGAYERGETIHIELCWMYESDIDDYAQIPQDMETAFNFNDNPLKLKVDVTAVSTWSDVYYNKMMIGKFDIAFGSISGNEYDPLNFFEVLKSDNSSGFTLNWGVDTSAIDGSIVYDDIVWSFDALWEVADHGAIVKDSSVYSLIDIYGADFKRQANGDLVVYIWADFKALDEDNFAVFTGLCIYATNDSDYETYSEIYVTMADAEHFVYDEAEGCYIITFDAETIAAWVEYYQAPVAQGFDIYVYELVDGKLYSPAGQGYVYLDDAKTVPGTYLTSLKLAAVPPIE